MEVVQIPSREWKRIARILDRLDKDQKPAGVKWMDAGPFAKNTGKTKEQLRYFRTKHPELVRPKPDSTQYQYDYSGYLKLYTA